MAISSSGGSLSTPPLSSINCTGSQWAREGSPPWRLRLSRKEVQQVDSTAPISKEFRCAICLLSHQRTHKLNTTKYTHTSYSSSRDCLLFLPCTKVDRDRASRLSPLAPLAFCHLLRCLLPKYSPHICNLFCLSIWAILNFSLFVMRHPPILMTSERYQIVAATVLGIYSKCYVCNVCNRSHLIAIQWRRSQETPRALPLRSSGTVIRGASYPECVFARCAVYGGTLEVIFTLRQALDK